MNQHSSIKGRGSLIERATQIYDFSAALKGRAAPAVDVPADAPLPPPVDVPVAPGAPDAPVTRAPAWTGPVQPIDRDALAQGGFLLPEGPVTVMSEEFRLLKRDLLAQLRDNPRGNRILVCSPNSGEGKSFCAINLALSLAA